MKVTKEVNQSGRIAYKCSCCGMELGSLPLTFGSGYPEYYFTIPEIERERRVEITDSLCVVDDEYFFIRGRLTIPIVDCEEDLIFNVWASLSKENFIRTNELWNEADRVNEPPYFGWLQTYVPTYGNTLNIKTQVITQDVGFIPKVIVTEENHPLALAQIKGIPLEKALSIVTEIIPDLHQETKRE
ncbi:DUF2199 domain-containing protein [Pontibacter mangrovi]|uniref:DUF2199 domain-containing protein n=1 Tax=Pontibacter mangrovi TaxID=2589816 RepID=A0A501W3D3_9BACT|nr:DUF2199 domain-containing protein [Pontibacter mangrovi]TPE42800.1 DUF2199 domain-containing protein [Pontibacter mangrovi]